MSDYSFSYQTYGGSLMAVTLLSGKSQTLILNDLGPITPVDTSDADGLAAVGATLPLGDLGEVTVLGSGTITPGVKLLGTILPLGASVPVILVENTAHQISFLYPEAAPDPTAAVAMVVSVAPTNYVLPVVCYTSGTPILTDRGWRVVESLRPGDRVQTLDQGLQPILWTNTTYIDHTEAQRLDTRPILIRKGALGPGVPRWDLRVSPQHRMLVANPLVEEVVGTPQCLVAARHLLSLPGITIDRGAPCFAYVHFMTATHDIVFAAGAPSETLFTGPEALKALAADPEAQDPLATLIQSAPACPTAPARPMVDGKTGRSLARRSRKSGMPMITDGLTTDQAA